MKRLNAVPSACGIIIEAVRRATIKDGQCLAGRPVAAERYMDAILPGPLFEVVAFAGPLSGDVHGTAKMLRYEVAMPLRSCR